MTPNFLILLALCVLVVVLASNSWRHRQGRATFPKQKRGMLLGLLVVVGALLALFAFRHP